MLCPDQTQDESVYLKTDCIHLRNYDVKYSTFYFLQNNYLDSHYCFIPIPGDSVVKIELGLHINRHF